MSCCSLPIRVIEPMVSGKTQLQQMSVIGFMKRPWQVVPAQAGASDVTCASKAMRTTARK